MDEPEFFLHFCDFMPPEPTFHTGDRITLVHPPQIHRNPERWNWRCVLPDYTNVWICLEGVGEMSVNDRALPIRPGSLFWLESGDHVQAHHSPGEPITNLALHLQFWQGNRRLGQVFPEAPNGHRLNSLALLEPLARRLVEMGGGVRPADRLRQERVVLGLLELLFDELERPAENPGDRPLRNVAESIRSHPERPWSVAEMARQAGFTREHFSRRFRKLFGMAPNAFLIRTRMEAAANLLGGSSLSVQEIADILGYQDIYFFSRQFRQKMGQSPSAYRKKAGEGTR